MRAPCGKAPPTWIGGCGFCTGLGLAIIGSKWTNSPWYSASDFVQISFIASMDFAHPLEAGGVDGAVAFHFVLVPTAADAEEEPSLAHLVDRGDQLGGLDRVALLHQQHAGAELDGLGNLARGSQHHERVHCVVVLFGQIASSWEWRLARQRDMRVLGAHTNSKPRSSSARASSIADIE